MRWKLTDFVAAMSVAALALVACTAPPSDDTPARTRSQSDNLVLASAKALMPPEGTQRADLPLPDSEGAMLLDQYCTVCHGLSSPGTHSTTDWPVVMRRMWLRTERVAEQHDIPVPNAAERLTMTRYMLEHAFEVAGDDLPDFVGREYYMLTCERCHALPDPRQHTSQDWPAVVTRMRQHMVDLLGNAPIEAELQDISAYLQQVSR